MPKGGPQPGAGRKPGTKNRTTIEREQMAALGIKTMQELKRTPLDIMLAKMNGDDTITDAQFAAAQAAAPYIHPRLQSTEATIKSDNVHRVVSDEPMDAAQWAATHAPANDQVSPPLSEDEERESA